MQQASYRSTKASGLTRRGGWRQSIRLIHLMTGEVFALLGLAAALAAVMTAAAVVVMI